MDSIVAFTNGKAEGYISVRDRGFNYGHGLFETIRIVEGRAPLWQWHRDRLCRDAAVLGIEVDNDLLSRYFSQALAAASAEGVLKLLVTAGNGSGGYRSSRTEANYYFQCRELPEKRGLLRLQVCDYRLPHNPVLAGIKHLNRLDQVMAGRELNAQYDGLLLDADDRVVEALSNNLFACFDGQWVSPELSLCGVKGVMREYLRTELFPSLGLSVKEAHFGLDKLAQAEAVFVCNAVRGVEAVQEILHCGEWSQPEAIEKVEYIRKHLASRVPGF